MPAFRQINHATVNVGKPHQPVARLGLGNPNRFANPRLADEHRLPGGKVSTISPVYGVWYLGTAIMTGCARLGCPTLILVGAGPLGWTALGGEGRSSPRRHTSSCWLHLRKSRYSYQTQTLDRIGLF